MLPIGVPDSFSMHCLWQHEANLNIHVTANGLPKIHKKVGCLFKGDAIHFWESSWAASMGWDFLLVAIPGQGSESLSAAGACTQGSGPANAASETKGRGGA